MERGMISVDKWSSGSQAYFLTHLHADHTVGLSSRWRRGPLFCSRLTARLFSCKFPHFDLSLLRVLDIGSWHTISLLAPSSGSPTTVCVKAIDAHHCPGSVMYLFSGDFGFMLFTGDFRWEASGNGVKTGRAMLLDSLKNNALNTLYLDNTYCNPRYSFPSREDASKLVVDIINSHPKHDVIIAIDSLGKEDLLLYISHALNIKIWVWPERLQVMHVLGYHENFTTESSLTRVRAVPRYSFSIETLEGLNRIRPTIGVMPSGLPWATKSMIETRNLFSSSPAGTSQEETTCNQGSSSSPKADNSAGGLSIASRYHEYIYVVPYSAHSCFSEIKDLIELLRPVNIQGIVSTSSCHIDPCYYFSHFCGAKQAFWRIQQSQENKEGKDTAEASVMKSPRAVRKKRRINQVDTSGVRVVSRVRLMRRLSHGVKITDTE